MFYNNVRIIMAQMFYNHVTTHSWQKSWFVGSPIQGAIHVPVVIWRYICPLIDFLAANYSSITGHHRICQRAKTTSVQLLAKQGSLQHSYLILQLTATRPWDVFVSVSAFQLDKTHVFQSIILETWTGWRMSKEWVGMSGLQWILSLSLQLEYT